MHWKPWKKALRPEMDPKDSPTFAVALELGLARARIDALKMLLQECVNTGMFQRGTTINDLERRVQAALEQ